MPVGRKVDQHVHAHAAHAKPAGEFCPGDDARVSKTVVAARVLVVEDQDDVRRMVATALMLDGYDVDEAATAHEGLRLLNRKKYRLVLSDYAMPGGTGAWMLSEAYRLGLMDGTSAMIVTAHPDVRDLAQYRVINKPLDLDELLDQVRKLVASSRIDSSAPVSSDRSRAKQNRT
ncbi:MAG TPA: response regulator [Vicinamibacterales bacterium]|jgi:DNA-binding NtrC family response regulator